MSEYYSRDGRPITYEQYRDMVADARTRGEDYKRVAFDKDVAGESDVSTVYLALDHAFEGPPLIFETMVFGGGLGDSCERYGTEVEARAGHVRWVAKVKREAEDFRRLAIRVGETAMYLARQMDEHAEKYDTSPDDFARLRRAISADVASP